MIMKNIIFTKITQIWFTLLYVECSRVTDIHDQKGFLYLEDYCPSIGACVEGSHVACQYYKPNQTMSEQCIAPKNLTMTKEYADLIMNSVNSMRGRIARGVPLKDKRFPRGYGIFRLEWDQELATFAQLWSNQCIMRHDSCRATQKFPDPGQLRALTVFDMDWTPLSGNSNRPGYDNSKIIYGCSTILAYWYREKNKLTNLEAIVRGHVWDESIYTSPFLQLILGSATHIGCGINAFMYTDITQTTITNKNTIRLVCNLSTRLHRGQIIYNMERPTKVGYTKKCGCPLGYDEDSRCLCYESGRGLPYSCKYGKCTPDVVILPIFTVENKPLPHINANTSMNERRNFNTQKTFQRNIGPSRYISQPKKHRTNTSIFAIAPIFELPKRKNINIKSVSTIRTDVSPRKDFSNIDNVVSSYFKTKQKNYTSKYLNNNFDKRYLNGRNNKYGDNEQLFDDTEELIHQDDVSPLRNIEMQSDSRVTSLRIPSQKLKTKPQTLTTEDSNKKLMDILNELEEEAKSLYLSNTEKAILNEKIKRIYDRFIDKSHKIDKNNVHNKEHNIKISDYSKTYLQSESDERRNSVPSDSRYYFNAKTKDYNNEGKEVYYNQNKISTRKMISLNAGKEKSMNKDMIFQRNYMKSTPRIKESRHYEEYMNDDADHNLDYISPIYLKSKWIFRRPQIHTFKFS